MVFAMLGGCMKFRLGQQRNCRGIVTFLDEETNPRTFLNIMTDWSITMETKPRKQNPCEQIGPFRNCTSQWINHNGDPFTYPRV